MFAVAYDFEVLDTVVALVLVDVVNVLVWTELAPQMALHSETMLIDQHAVFVDPPIARNAGIAALVIAVLRAGLIRHADFVDAGARMRAILTLLSLPAWNRERLVTVWAL